MHSLGSGTCDVTTQPSGKNPWASSRSVAVPCSGESCWPSSLGVDMLRLIVLSDHIPPRRDPKRPRGGRTPIGRVVEHSHRHQEFQTDEAVFENPTTPRI